MSPQNSNKDTESGQRARDSLALDEMLKNTPDIRVEDDAGEPYFEGDIPANLDRMTRSDDTLTRFPRARAQRPAKGSPEYPNPITTGRPFDGAEARKGYKW